MKFRRHHNTKGYRQIQRGKTYLQVERIKKIARQLGILKDRNAQLGTAPTGC